MSENVESLPVFPVANWKEFKFQLSPRKDKAGFGEWQAWKHYYYYSPYRSSPAYLWTTVLI